MTRHHQPAVDLGNFEIPTRALRVRCSASELQIHMTVPTMECTDNIASNL